MKKFPVIFFLITIASVLILKENLQKRPSEPLSEGCLFCHNKVTDPDSSHPVSAFGCYTCHSGNPYSLNEKRAHFGVVRNPGDLRVAERTCGKEGCHSDIVPRVKKSIMATNRGILKTLQYQWLNITGAKTGVRDLMGKNPPENLAIDHYRKMCGGCHLWKERGDRAGEVGKRGGGCSDCHVLDKNRKEIADAGPFDHPVMTTRIPSENCVKCHNRSARIGLSYFGRFESARYGTPYEGRDLSSRRLSGNRFFLHLEADIHFAKAGMECIDCHTATGLMGDGKAYDEMEDQVDITCEACHVPRFSLMTDSETLSHRLAFLNKKVPKVQNERIAMSRKDTPLYNVQKKESGTVFFRKMDGRAVKMDVTSSKNPYHTLPGHERLSCQACHSSWIPQCYGCHLEYRKSELQRDWLTGKKSPGKWKETRSYMRFARPGLGFKDAFTIYPVSPCQVFASFKILTMSAFDPHTTSKESRSCLECHGDPKVLGVGEGILNKRDGKWIFRPTYDAVSSGLGAGFPLDAYVSLNGERLQTASREDARPFKRQEINSILSVNACLGCHNQYNDKIYRDFKVSMKRFKTERNLPCRE